MANRGNLSNLIAPGYRKIVFETYKERPLEGIKLVNKNSSKRAYEEDFNMAGFGTLQQRAEGGQITFQDPIQGSVKRYIWTSFGLGFRITEELYEDDLYGMVGGKLSKALARSARNNAEIVMHSPYNNAFSTSFVGFNAGESLCSTSHALLRGGTSSNRPATDVDFGLLPLQAALEHFHNLVTEEGFPAMFIPRTVIHSVSDHWLVQQVLKSQMLPGTNANDINQVSNEGLKAHLSHYLTDTDAWFVLADQHDINYFERKPFQFTNSDDFYTGDALFKGTTRRGAGFGDWRGIYGSAGI